MDEMILDGSDEQLRRACEERARAHWPGARVLVHRTGDRYRAAVFLAEDGVDPDASAERSELKASPGAALSEVRDALDRQKTMISS
jgi:hypothetical protein